MTKNILSEPRPFFLGGGGDGISNIFKREDVFVHYSHRIDYTHAILSFLMKRGELRRYRCAGIHPGAQHVIFPVLNMGVLTLKAYGTNHFLA